MEIADQVRGTDREPSENGTGFADQSRTTDAEREWIEDECSQGFCYFIGGDGGAIKIGSAADVRKRLKQLQLSSPVKLKVLAKVYGGRRIEKSYHIRFCRERLHGEWFGRSPEILAEIERLNPQPRVNPPIGGCGCHGDSAQGEL